MNNNKKEIEELLSDESEHLKKLHKIVRDTLTAEDLIIHNLMHPPLELLSPGQKLSDKIAKFGGSWRFIRWFGIVLGAWIAFNIVVAVHFRFDPYPFILMNLVLSCIAALQAPVIMMSQNRSEEKDRKRNENDYLINLKAEMQIRSLHEKMNLLLEEQIKTLFETQKNQIALLVEINQKLDKLEGQKK